MNGTKDQILPIMEALEAGGAFNGPAKRPWYLMRAAYNQDEIKQLAKENRTLPPESEYPDRIGEAAALAAAPPPLDPNSFAGLQQRCKAAGINCMGANKIWMQEALAKQMLGVGVPASAAEAEQPRL